MYVLERFMRILPSALQGSLSRFETEICLCDLSRFPVDAERGDLGFPVILRESLGGFFLPHRLDPRAVESVDYDPILAHAENTGQNQITERDLPGGFPALRVDQADLPPE